jgi:hypothetical protein
MITGNTRFYIIFFLIFLMIFLLMKCTSPDKKIKEAVQYADFAGSSSCLTCHKDIYEKHQQTEHFLSSKPSKIEYVKGSFTPGNNEYHYSAASMVKMEKQHDSLFQTEYMMEDQIQKHLIDIVVGSGRKGQSFLSWKRNSLVQLPVTYFTPESTWSTSPGFNPGKPAFNRVITSRCLECHSTWFQKTSDDKKHPEEFDKLKIVYGVDCEKCHGPAKKHVEYHLAKPGDSAAKHIVNPAHLSRQLKTDLCALCHSGRLEKTKPSFSFQAGDKLSDYFSLPNTTSPFPNLDVHGNQLGLLSISKCFIESDMTCMNCHNVHENEKGKLELFSQRCINCHNSKEHKECRLKSTVGEIINKNCIDCHMPLQQSQSITVYLEGAGIPTTAKLRTHYIKIYKEETQKILDYFKTNGNQ